MSQQAAHFKQYFSDIKCTLIHKKQCDTGR